MMLIPFAEFPSHERDTLLALLRRLRIPARDVCVSRVAAAAGQEDAGMPTVVLVSAPGWWCAYEGEDWLLRVERDLVAHAPTEVQA